MALECLNGGYLDPNDCSHCRCPDGLSGRQCNKSAPSVGGKYSKAVLAIYKIDRPNALSLVALSYLFVIRLNLLLVDCEVPLLWHNCVTVPYKLLSLLLFFCSSLDIIPRDIIVVIIFFKYYYL